MKRKNDEEEIKDILVKLISNTRIGQFSTYESEDIVDACFSKCREVISGEDNYYNDIGEVISDYLDLGAGYVPLIFSIL